MSDGFDFGVARQKLHSKIAKIHAERNPTLELDKTGCDHEWNKYKQTIEPRDGYQGGRAYFIIKACIKCKTKLTVNYVQEK